MNNQLKHLSNTQLLEELKAFAKELSYYNTCLNQKSLCQALEKVTGVLQIISERLDKLEEEQKNNDHGSN